MNAILSIAFATWAVSQGEAPRLDGVKVGLSSPMIQLERSTDALLASLHGTYPSWSPEAEQQRSAVERIIRDSMDYREFGRRTLRGHWEGLSDRDRAAFIAALEKLLESRCVASEDSGSKFKVRFERETVAAGGTASVFATASGNARGKQVRMSIEYRLLWKSDHWSMYDLVTDGVSLVESYRAQFDRILGRESFEGLLRRMKRQADIP